LWRPLAGHEDDIALDTPPHWTLTKRNSKAVRQDVYELRWQFSRLGLDSFAEVLIVLTADRCGHSLLDRPVDRVVANRGRRFVMR
jgi:hypothetical protein